MRSKSNRLTEGGLGTAKVTLFPQNLPDSKIYRNDLFTGADPLFFFSGPSMLRGGGAKKL